MLTEFFKPYNHFITTMPNAPALGTKDCFNLEDPELEKLVAEHQNDLSEINAFSHSRFTIDKTINSHPRFGGLVKSIREHRGEKVSIKVPLF